MQTVLDFLIKWWGALSLGGVVVALGVAWGIWGFWTAVRAVTTTLGGLVFIVLWSVPAILLLIGWVMPSLHVPIEFPPPNPKTTNGLLLLVGVGVPTLIADIAVTATTSGKWQIQRNLLVSALWVMGIYHITGRVSNGGYEFWYMSALLWSGVSLLAGIFFGVHNAWNKNPTQASVEGGRL